jgi:hypothetical protein
LVFIIPIMIHIRSLPSKRSVTATTPRLPRVIRYIACGPLRVTAAAERAAGRTKVAARTGSTSRLRLGGTQELLRRDALFALLLVTGTALRALAIAGY